MIALLTLLACTGGLEATQADLDPVEIGLAECGVCGMVVGEQPSPRAQLAYRDGTHVHICSIEEARALAAAPGGRGHAVAIWVEALPPDFDWSTPDTEPLPWIDAEDAHFVYGIERKGVMGVPVLSYADAAVAERVAAKLGTTPVSWTDLVDTPVPGVPEKAGWTPTAHRSTP